MSFNMLCNVPFGINSLTRKGKPSGVFPWPWNDTRLGCRIRAMALASIFNALDREETSVASMMAASSFMRLSSGTCRHSAQGDATNGDLGWSTQPARYHHVRIRPFVGADLDRLLFKHVQKDVVVIAYGPQNLTNIYREAPVVKRIVRLQQRNAICYLITFKKKCNVHRKTTYRAGSTGTIILLAREKLATDGWDFECTTIPFL